MHAACRIKTCQTNEFAQFQLVWNPTLSHARRSGRGSSAAAALAHRRLTGTAADLTRVRVLIRGLPTGFAHEAGSPGTPALWLGCGLLQPFVFTARCGRSRTSWFTRAS